MKERLDTYLDPDKVEVDSPIAKATNIRQPARQFGKKIWNDHESHGKSDFEWDEYFYWLARTASDLVNSYTEYRGVIQYNEEKQQFEIKAYISDRMRLIEETSLKPEEIKSDAYKLIQLQKQSSGSKREFKNQFRNISLNGLQHLKDSVMDAQRSIENKELEN